jgi:hypothetical protein
LPLVESNKALCAGILTIGGGRVSFTPLDQSQKDFFHKCPFIVCGCGGTTTNDFWQKLEEEKTSKLVVY